MKLNRLFFLNLQAMADGGGDTGGDGGGDGDPSGGAPDGAAGGGDWRSNLPESVREWQEAQTAPDADTFYKSLGDMRSQLGRSLTIPTNEAGDEARAEFMRKVQEKVPGLIQAPNFENEEDYNNMLKRMGRPDDVNGYERPEGVPDERWEVLADAAFKSGLTRKQFKGVLNQVIETEKSANMVNEERSAQEMANLNLEWGPAKEGKVNRIVNLLKRSNAPEHLVNSAINGTLDAGALRWLDGVIGGLGGEASEMWVGHDQANAGGTTPAEAEQRISEIWANRAHPYHNKRDPGHGAAKLEMERLYAIVTPYREAKNQR
jgi:hypothetical protein